MDNLHPGLILILTGILTLAVPEKAGKLTALIGAAVSAAAMLSLDVSAAISFCFTSDITMELLRVDPLSRLFGLIFCVIALLSGIYSFENQKRGERSAALIYAGSSICVVFAGDLVSLICFWEIMAVASCCLVFAGRTEQAKQASYRYLLMHFFGGNLLLSGIVLLLSEGHTQLELLSDDNGWAFWLIFLGVAVNGAIPPLHTWVPDAYPQSSPTATVYLGSYTTKAAIYVMIRLFAGMEELVMIGALTAIFGACMALIENNLRRLLSYHIVSQLGMMTAALGTGIDVGIDGAALHAVFNILYKGVLLMGAGAVLQMTGTEKITELGGLYRKMPVTASCFLIASLAIAGVPPLNGFVSKGLVMESLKEGGFTAAYWLVMLAGIGTWLSITLKINWFVFFGKEGKRDRFGTGGKLTVSGKGDEVGPSEREPRCMQAAMILGTSLCILTGVFPDRIYSFLPQGSIGHPYTASHVAEYLFLFAGATGAFFLMRKKMFPHDQLTLDFDWFYRKPLAKAVERLSVLVVKTFQRFEISAENFVWAAKVLPNSPAQILRAFEKWHREEDNMPVGQFMQMFIIFCIIAFVFILIIE